MRFELDLLLLFLFDHVDGEIGQVANDRFDVAADVTHFRELRGFDFDKRSLGELCQTAGDFGFADSRRPDHDDIFRGDFLAQIFGNELAPPTIAQRDRHRPFRFLLADDITIEL